MYKEITANLATVREPTEDTARIPCDVMEICSDLKSLAQESFQILTLNGKNKVIDRHMITLGLVNKALAHPREVYRPAIADSASAIILVHNHPSGDPTPSAEDIRVTRQLIDAGKIIGIHPLDHIIIGHPDSKGRDRYISLREEGLCEFS